MSPRLRAILHVDMDAFFAAIEQRDRPELRGLPIAVGGDGRRSVVAAASYEARAFGVRSAMPMHMARRLCPQLRILPVRFARYAEVSRQVFELARRFTPQLEPLSLDEAFLDVTASQRLFGHPTKIASELRQAIADELGLTASAGVAHNKWLAKLACEMNKPNGQTTLPPPGPALDALLAPLPLERMYGVGPRALARCHALGLRTMGQLARADSAWLARALGRHALALQQRARGHDDREVISEREAKSVGSERTYEQDRVGFEESWQALLEQCTLIAARLWATQRQARTLHIKLRQPDFRTFSLQMSLPAPEHAADALSRAARALLLRFVDEQGAEALRFRLVGASASQLSELDVNYTLFDDPLRQKRDALAEAKQRLSARGAAPLTPATLLRAPGRK